MLKVSDETCKDTVIRGTAFDVIEKYAKQWEPKVPGIVFMDHVRELYLQDLKAMEHVGWMKKRTILVADNALVPGAPDFVDYVSTHPKYSSEQLKATITFPDGQSAVDALQFRSAFWDAEHASPSFGDSSRLSDDQSVEVEDATVQSPTFSPLPKTLASAGLENLPAVANDTPTGMETSTHLQLPGGSVTSDIYKLREKLRRKQANYRLRRSASLSELREVRRRDVLGYCEILLNLDKPGGMRRYHFDRVRKAQKSSFGDETAKYPSSPLARGQDTEISAGRTSTDTDLSDLHLDDEDAEQKPDYRTYRLPLAPPLFQDLPAHKADVVPHESLAGVDPETESSITTVLPLRVHFYPARQPVHPSVSSRGAFDAEHCISGEELGARPIKRTRHFLEFLALDDLFNQFAGLDLDDDNEASEKLSSSVTVTESTPLLIDGKGKRPMLKSPVSQMGFLCGGSIFIVQNMQQVVKSISQDTYEVSTLHVLIIFGCILTPMCLIRRIARLSWTAILADGLILVGLVVLLYFDFQRLLLDNAREKTNSDLSKGIQLAFGPNINLLFDSTHASIFIGTAIYSFEGIGLVIPIRDAMMEPEKFPTVLTGVMILLSTVLTIIGALGYLAYGDLIQTVALLNLPPGPVVLSMQVLYSFGIVFSGPLCLYPAIRIFEQAIFAPHRRGKYSLVVKWEKNLLRISIVCVTLCVAYFGASDLDKFVSLIGSVCCTPLSLIFPPIFHLKAVAHKPWQIGMDIALVIFGLVCMIFTMLITARQWAQ
ncbi:hypothetical protein BZG36_03775 [Bifiguratus adelaidae]|uniref:Amino acid transporter transmembrane domain-containing protein n=1 Tax=Bifiguratus adelaidae TaxID=1938954 RepID=A0A261XXF6_9FUNG|nr:hypothetical protein BZG36_03775 [Bifiguratus adelaidae]